MRGVRTATGIALGAGLGMLAGLLANADDWIWWLIVGSAAGLIIGAIMDSRQSDSDDSPPD